MEPTLSSAPDNILKSRDCFVSESGGFLLRSQRLLWRLLLFIPLDLWRACRLRFVPGDLWPCAHCAMILPALMMILVPSGSVPVLPSVFPWGAAPKSFGVSVSPLGT